MSDPIHDKSMNGHASPPPSQADLIHAMAATSHARTSDDDLRKVKAAIANIQLQRLEGTVVNVEDIRDGLELIAARIRKAAETIGEEFGPKALSILTGAMDDVLLQIKKMFPRDP